MRKHLSILIAFLLISIVFLSGCTDQGVFTLFEGTKPEFEEFSCDKTTGEHPLTVKFNSLGASDESEIISYNWDFGDGKTSDKQNPTHTFYLPGTYIVKLTIRDEKNRINQNTMEITVIQANSLPIATVSSDTDRGRAPLTVKFTSSATDSDGHIVSYSWDFDDGTNSNEQNPTHTFETKRSYLVELTVTDNDGGSITKSIRIYGLGNSAPKATATSDKTSGTVPLHVKFTGSGTDSDGSIVSYSWDFDDESTSTQQNPSHTFITAGTYNVQLIVEDNERATGSDTLTIKVTPEEEDPEDPGGGEPPATTLYTYSPVDDAYVDSEFPDKTFGNKDKNFLTVKSYPSQWIDDHYVYSYLKFDLRSLPADAEVYSAKLRLYTYMSFNILGTPYMKLHQVNNNSWDESTITFNNQPYTYPGIIDKKLINAGDDYIEWDLTYYVKYHPGEIISLRISSSDSGNAVFHSEESFLCDSDEYPILKLQIVE